MVALRKIYSDFDLRVRWSADMQADHELPNVEFPIPREVMWVVDNIVPRIPRLEDFGTELLVQHGFQVLHKKWRVPAKGPEPAVAVRRKFKNRYQ